MSIRGVKELTINTIKHYRITLDRQVTNGHDFCELIVDEEHQNFTARLYGGEVYTYGWGGNNENFLDFLIDTFRRDGEYGYLYTKLQNHTITNGIDAEKTGEHLRTLLDEAKDNGMLEDDDYDDLVESVESFQNEDHMTESHFYDMYFNWFEDAIKQDIFPSEPWSEDFVERKEDFQCRVFCTLVAPILADVLEAEKNAH